MQLSFTAFLAGASLTLSTLSSGGNTAVALGNPSPAEPTQLRSQGTLTSTVSPQLADGVYLYGQSVKPEQVGQAYFVFESRQGKVVGALYMPRSSFDCAYGALQPNQLTLTVVNSYDKTTNPYAIALQPSTVATTGGATVGDLSLDGFHRIATVSQNDRRILAMCQANYQDRV